MAEQRTPDESGTWPRNGNVLFWLATLLVVNGLFFTASGQELLSLAAENWSRASRILLAQGIFAIATLLFLVDECTTLAGRRIRSALPAATFVIMGAAFALAATRYTAGDARDELVTLAIIQWLAAVAFAFLAWHWLKRLNGVIAVARWMRWAAIAAFVIIATWPVTMGSMLGPEIVLSVFGWVLLSVAYVLRYEPVISHPFTFPRVMPWVVGAWKARSYIVITLVVIGLARNTHDVRTFAHDATTLKDNAVWRKTVDLSLDDWYLRHKDENGRAVAILVGAAGGGIRASYWTAAVLASLDQVDGFRDHLFVISSVSGGSLGAVMFRAAITSSRGEASPIKRKDEWAAFQGVLTAEFLGPVVGGLLFSDVVGAVWPFKTFTDRAEALERSWERAWASEWDNTLLEEDFRALWPANSCQENDDKPCRRWPHLVLNGASMTRGVTFVTSDLSDIGEGAKAFPRVQEVPPLRFRSSTAVNNTARFPVIAPPGLITVDPQSARAAIGYPFDDDMVVDDVVDGGYIDNYGSYALVEILDKIRHFNCKLVRDHGQKPVKTDGCDQYQRHHDAPGIVPIVIQITSDPELFRATMDSCGCLDAPGAWGLRDPFARNLGWSLRSDVPAFSDTFAPATALDRMRQMSGIFAAISLAERSDVEAYFHFGIGPPYSKRVLSTEPMPSLNWALSGRSQRQIDAYLQQCQGLQAQTLAAMIKSPGNVREANLVRRQETRKRANSISEEQRRQFCR